MSTLGGRREEDRHPFTSIFLVLFLVDAVLGIGSGAAFLTGRRILDPDRLEFLLAPFSLGLLLGALVQVSLAFGRRMRWAARIIGLYVIAYYLVPSLVLVATLPPEALDAAGDGGPPISDATLGGFSLAVGGVQLLLGLWAVRDLAAGHYLPPRERSG